VKLDWTGPALADIRGIDHHLSQYSPEAAAQHLASIIDSADILKSYPAIGPALDGATRSLRVRHTRYLLIYRIRGAEVEILRVRHDREDWRPE
jgi:plasmid stabilization system protein ParE